jgi:hypothetical protein
MKGWTMDNINDYKRKVREGKAPVRGTDVMIDLPKAKAKPAHVTGRMNGTERRFFLEHVKDKPHLFEGVKFRLADNTWYMPDFMVIEDGGITFYEIKGGFVRDTGRAKFKIAAEMNPWFTWKWAQYKDKKWTIETY